MNNIVFKKTLITIGCFFLTYFLYSQDTICKSEAKKTLKEFYTIYLKETSYTYDENKINRILNKYCTLKLIKQINNPDIDWDLLIDGQFCEESWIKTLEIATDTSCSNVFYVKFYYYRENKKINKEIKLYVIKENNTYKIDKVLFNHKRK